MIEFFKEPWKPVFLAVGFVCFAYLAAFPVKEWAGGLQETHIKIMGTASANAFPPLVYNRCLTLDRCSEMLRSKLRGNGSIEPRPWPLNKYLPIAIVGLMMTITPLAARKQVKPPYRGRFATEGELANVTFRNWENNPALDYAIVVGFYHRMPSHEEEDYRDQVIRAEKLSETASGLVAVPMGYGGRRELGHEITTGMTRSGKSLKLIAQGLIWKGTFISLDVKGEIYDLTAGARSELGPVYVLSPDGKGNRFDAIGEFMKMSKGALVAANILLRPEAETRPEFARRGAQALAAIFEAAHLTDQQPLELVRKIIRSGGIRAFFREVASLPYDSVRDYANTFLGVQGVEADGSYTDDIVAAAASDRYLQSSWSDLTTKMGPLLDDNALWTFSGNDFRASDLVSEPCSVYLDFPEATLSATSRIYDLLMQGLMYGVTSYVDKQRRQQGQRWNADVPIFTALDELAVAPIYGLGSLLSTASGRGITCSVYLQDINQLKGPYGDEATNTLLNNVSVENFFKTNSLETARFISERFGETSIKSESRTRVTNRWNRPMSKSESSSIRKVFTVEEAFLMGGETRQTFISIISGKRQAYMKRINWFETGLQELVTQYPIPEIQEMGVIETLRHVGGGEDAHLEPTDKEVKPHVVIMDDYEPNNDADKSDIMPGF